MNKLFMLLGRSSCGKDTLMKRVIDEGLAYPLIYHTTRHIREGEINGVQYFFGDENDFKKSEESGSILEYRSYNVHGSVWYYWTEYDIQFRQNKNLICTGTLDMLKSYRDKIIDYDIIPIMITVNDLLLVERALGREKQMATPNIVEMCRRYISDYEDYSSDKVRESNIQYFISNDSSIEESTNKLFEIVNQHISQSLLVSNF